MESKFGIRYANLMAENHWCNYLVLKQETHRKHPKSQKRRKMPSEGKPHSLQNASPSNRKHLLIRLPKTWAVAAKGPENLIEKMGTKKPKFRI